MNIWSTLVDLSMRKHFILILFWMFLEAHSTPFSQQVKPIISKGSLRESFCFFFSLERFPKSILVVWPREWYQINPQNIWNKRIEPIFDWRSQNCFWDLQSSLTVSFSHVWMSKWVKNSFRNFKNPFLRSKNQIFFLTQ